MAGAAALLGVPALDIASGLASFRGVGRRLERKGEAAGVVVYDDYGHHPTAVRATLEAVRQREPGRPVWAVYEPLTYHRTAAMLDAFADALAGADAVAVADIWAGRDPDTTITSAAALAEAVAERAPGMPVLAPGSVEATADALAGVVHGGDVVLVMGGGHSYRIGERLLRTPGGDVMVDYAAAATCSRRMAGHGRRSTVTAGSALFTEDAEYHEDPFGAPLVGHNALRAYLLDASASAAGRRIHSRTPLGLGRDGPGRLARRASSSAASGDTGAEGRLPDGGSGLGRPDRPVPRVVDGLVRHRRVGKGGSMAGDQSFDVVSDFDEQELRNALDQVRREVGTRFDFKGVTVDLTQSKDELILVTDDEYRAAARQGPHRIEGDQAQPVAQDLRLGQGRGGRRQQGPPADRAAARAAGDRRQADHEAHPRRVPEVQVQIQGDAVRVSGKSKDDLQRVIARLRELDEPVPLQFENYR